ncbi:MAG: hypothetical protein MZU95_07260 [Desulfomicrobium escambiense]|nr:hypothetical protein [Desulfomicrobium escambiense]
MAKKTKRLLFVCYGNICRSPMAEGIARKRLGPAAEVASAGIGGDGRAGLGGGRPGHEDRLRRSDISSHVARPVGAFDLGSFDARHRHGRLHLQPPPGHLGGAGGGPLRLGHRGPDRLGLRRLTRRRPCKIERRLEQFLDRGRPRRLRPLPPLPVHHRPEEAERRDVLEDDPQRRQERARPGPGPECPKARPRRRARTGRGAATG